jgi:hypothetical protein
MSKTTNKFSHEARSRAVRPVLEHEHQHPSRWATILIRLQRWSADIWEFALQLVGEAASSPETNLARAVAEAKLNRRRRGPRPLGMSETYKIRQQWHRPSAKQWKTDGSCESVERLMGMPPRKTALRKWGTRLSVWL